MPQRWDCPRLWPNSTVYVLGGGPSLTDVDLTPLHSKRVLAVNNSYGDPSGRQQDGHDIYDPRPWVDALYFGDCRWYDWHRKALLDFGGLKVTSCQRGFRWPGIKWVSRANKAMGLTPRPYEVVWNRSSGASAVNLAVHLGATKIILLGFDMQPDDKGRANWHDDHPVKVRNRDVYPRFREPFIHIKNDAHKMGVEILNATEGSALTDFPMVKLEETL